MTPDWFLPTISQIINHQVPTPVHPPLLFELSDRAAIHNRLLLQQHGNSIHDLISAYPNSFLSPGSEFRPIQVLEPLLMHHHNWPKIKNILLMGSMWPLHPIPEVERKTKNLEFIARGNHKSAVKYAAEYTKILNKEINQG